MTTRIPEFISGKIKAAFEELTIKLSDELADELAEEHGEDMPAGALAFEMMAAEMSLTEAWRQYCEKKQAGQP